MSRNAALTWVFLHLGVGVAEAAQRGPDPLGECPALQAASPAPSSGVVAGSDNTVNGSVTDTSDWNMTVTDPGPPAVAR